MSLSRALLRISVASLVAALVTAGSACGERTEAPPVEAPAEHSVRVLATGAAISGANGIHFGPDGLLYVASVLGSELVVLDPDSGEVKRRIAEGVDSPDDVAFHSDGTVYWTSILTGEVAGLRPDGSRVRAAQLTPGSNPITFSPDDRLFVSQCFFDDKLYEVDPAGVEAPRLISDELGPHCGLNGMDWGPDDRLYGPRWFRGEVVSFDVDSLEMRTEADGFKVPAAVKFDSKGRLHVLDTAEGAVVRVDGDERQVVASFEPGLDNLAFDENDRLFVSSFVDGSVARVEPDGSNTLIAPAGLAHPGGVTLRQGDRGREVVVADLQSVRGFDADTGESTFVHRNVFGVSEMGSATNISMDGANMILTSWLDGTVKIWDPEAASLVASHGPLAQPVSALRYEGRIVVAEHGSGRVIALGSEGAEAAVIASNLPAPTGLAVSEGDLFVSDRARGEVLRIARGGVALQPPEVVATGLSSPEGLAIGPRGLVVVEGDSGRILEIDPGGESRVIASIEGGSPPPSDQQPPSMVFNGIAVGDDGAVFATGEARRILYRIDPP
jgi:sugar lactone lactonase YvrE